MRRNNIFVKTVPEEDGRKEEDLQEEEEYKYQEKIMFQIPEEGTREEEKSNESTEICTFTHLQLMPNVYVLNWSPSTGEDHVPNSSL